MKRVGKPNLLGHLFDQRTGLLQAFSGVVHLEPEQVLVRGLVVVTPEQSAQIGVVDMALASDLLQRPQAQAVLFNMAATLLIGRERERFRAGERRVRPDDAKRQTLQKFCAQHCAFAASLRPGLDEFIKKRL